MSQFMNTIAISVNINHALVLLLYHGRCETLPLENTDSIILLAQIFKLHKMKTFNIVTEMKSKRSYWNSIDIIFH